MTINSIPSTMTHKAAIIAGAAIIIAVEIAFIPAAKTAAETVITPISIVNPVANRNIDTAKTANDIANPNIAKIAPEAVNAQAARPNNTNIATIAPNPIANVIRGILPSASSAVANRNIDTAKTANDIANPNIASMAPEAFNAKAVRPNNTNIATIAPNPIANVVKGILPSASIAVLKKSNPIESVINEALIPNRLNIFTLANDKILFKPIMVSSTSDKAPKDDSIFIQGMDGIKRIANPNAIKPKENTINEELIPNRLNIFTLANDKILFKPIMVSSTSDKAPKDDSIFIQGMD
ncbi:MAG: hypothetical protein PHC75_10750, partial [Burkholderiales bacterium]|nr:hypothetical protein [Burkholderiales bacterium]